MLGKFSFFNYFYKMRKKPFWGAYILILITSNLLTAAIICLNVHPAATERSVLYSINAEKQNILLLQATISRLEKQDTTLLNDLERMKNEIRYSYEKFDISDLLKKYFPEEFP